MTTDLLENSRWSTADTDLSTPGSNNAELAMSKVVKAWYNDRKTPTIYFLNPLHATGDETYDIPLEAWRDFDRILSTYTSIAHARMPFSTDVVEKRTPFNMLLTSPEVNFVKEVRRHHYAELSNLLDEWANDPSDFDKSVAPLIEEALRETAPRHFPDE